MVLPPPGDPRRYITIAVNALLLYATVLAGIPVAVFCLADVVGRNSPIDRAALMLPWFLPAAFCLVGAVMIYFRRTGLISLQISLLLLTVVVCRGIAVIGTYAVASETFFNSRNLRKPNPPIVTTLLWIGIGAASLELFARLSKALARRIDDADSAIKLIRIEREQGVGAIFGESVGFPIEPNTSRQSASRLKGVKDGPSTPR